MTGKARGAAMAMAMALCATGCGPNGRCELSDAGPATHGSEEVEVCDRLPEVDRDCEAPAKPCVTEDERCVAGSQCASGLTCAEVAPRDPCFTSERDGGCWCRPIAFDRLATGSRRLALQQGFAVGGMPSSVDTAEIPPRLTWQAPKNARIVACALFSCTPSFAHSGYSPTDEVTLFKIDNFEQCVLLFGAFPATQPGFILGHENAYQDAYQDAPRCTAPEAGSRVVTELSAGCWAYDNTSIVAASELHPIRGSLLAGLPGLPPDAACPVPGGACYDATADVFGVCLGGACRPRCRSPVDCSLRDPAPTTSGTCGWSCLEVPGQALGACVPVP
jgi:hypothetical protein